MSWDFILTGWRRSGTTMFASLLKDHPRVSCDSDRFNYYYHGERYIDFLRHARPNREPGVTAAGLKLLDPFMAPDWKYPRMRVRAGRDGGLDRLPDQKAYQAMVAAFTQRIIDAKPQVLNLVRHALHVYVSEQIALQRREFKYRTDFEDRFRHVFDIDHFERWFARKREIEERTAFLKAPERTLTVFYEDLMSPEHREATLEEAFRHIGVEPRSVQPATRKQLPTSLRDSVVNFDEMIASLRGGRLPHLADGLE